MNVGGSHSVSGMLERWSVVFWDFDGVIKDSVRVKSEAFEQLFGEFGRDVATKVREHHEANGGMSRFDKLPVYLRWSGVDPTDELIALYSSLFSDLVKDRVIESPWVPGVCEYLYEHVGRQKFFLVTATPQYEIEAILAALGFEDLFLEVIGAPIEKSEAIRLIMERNGVASESAVMIGDSRSDYDAAVNNQVAFILRRTDLNQNMQSVMSCLMINDFKKNGMGGV